MKFIDQSWSYEEEIDSVKILKKLEKAIRTCYRSEDKITSDVSSAESIIGKIIDNKHDSVLEHCGISVRIITNRGVTHELVRHRLASFCLSGESEIYFDLPRAIRNNNRQLYKIKLKDLYKKWNEIDAFHTLKQNRIKKMFVRCFDEKTQTLTHAHIKNVLSTGKKELYKITLDNDKFLICTKEHKVLTKEGFKSLKEYTGLDRHDTTAYFSNKNALIGCNGIEAYKDYEWMRKAKERSLETKKGLSGIADECGMSPHTIHKWLRTHNLQFSQQEKGIIRKVWNKNRYGYSISKWTDKMKKDFRERNKIRRGGKEINYSRIRICQELHPHRKKIFEKFDYKCQLCGEKFKGKIELHHILPVKTHPEKALDLDNIIPVHKTCHYKHHGGCVDIRNISKLQNKLLTASWHKIKKVEYVGEEETYDLEIDHDSHNYVANGIIVHNSQESTRYCAYNKDKFGNELTFIHPVWVDEDINTMSELDLLNDGPLNRFVYSLKRCEQDYFALLNRGWKAEQAREVLPNALKTEIVMTANLREWRTIFRLRTTIMAHPQIRSLMINILEDFKSKLPIIFKDINP